MNIKCISNLYVVLLKFRWSKPEKNYLEQRYTCIYLLGPEELNEVQYVSQQVCSTKPYPLDRGKKKSHKRQRLPVGDGLDCIGPCCVNLDWN